MRRLPLLFLVLGIGFSLILISGRLLDTTTRAASTSDGTDRVVSRSAGVAAPDDARGAESPAVAHFDAAPSRRVIASRWSSDTRDEHVSFRRWTERYLATPPGAARTALEAEGLRLAAVRRAALARLIVEDPEAALASAAPAALRSALPKSVDTLLERRVSARGELALNAITPAPGRAIPGEATYYSALIEGAEYRAYVYGRRSMQATIASAALSGIAVDRLLAVSESPVRLLEPGEAVAVSTPQLSTCATCSAAAGAPPPGSVLYEYAGAIGAAPTRDHFLTDAALLEAAETDLTEADNRPGSSTVVGRPTTAWTHGQKKVLIIRVDFADKPGAPQSEGGALTEARAVELFTEAGGVGDFYLASSFGGTSITIRPASDGDSPDVTPVLRLPRNAVDYAVTGESAKLHDDARAAAEKVGYDISAYDRVGVVFSSLTDLVDGSTGAKSKITYGGLATVIGPNFWVNGAYSFRVVAHELGHTYGLRHANLWKVSDGNPVSEGGRSLEYGDPFDLMGGGEDFSATEDFGPWNKSLLQWIPDASLTVAGKDGVYRVHRIDAAGADLGLPRALKIVRDPTRDYWIGYRRDTSNVSLDGGANVVWGYNSNRPCDLLDLATPGSDPRDSALAIGTTFNDGAAAITLKPVAQGGEGADEWIDIEVSIGRRVQWVSSSVLASEQGGAVTLVLRRSGSSAGPISVAYGTEDGTAKAGSDYSAASGVVTWGDGDMADKTVSVVLAPDGEVERSESFRVILGAVDGGVRVGAAAAAVAIVESGANDDTFLADFIGSTVNRMLPMPDGGVLVGGNFTQIQDSAGALMSGLGRIARFTASGAFDVDFSAGAGANGQVRGFALQPNGRILVIGDFTTFAGSPAGRIVRLFPDGSMDRSFKPGAGADEDIHDIVLQPDGRILIAGAFTKFGSVARNRLVRLMPDGAVDTSFANPGFSATILRTIALQPDGKVLVGGGLSYSGMPGVGFKSGVARLNANGSRDASFDVGHGSHTASATNTLTSVFRLALQPDGRILVAGSFTGFGGLGGKPRQFLARLSATGAVDPTFAPAFSFPATMPVEQRLVTALRVLPGNRVLVGGNFTGVDATSCSRCALLNPDGAPDASFAEAGGLAGRVMDLAILPDGKALLAGDPAFFQGSARQRPIWRFVPGLAGAPGAIGFSSDAYAGREGNTVTLTVRRTNGSLGAVTVAYAAARANAADTATSGDDYTLAAGTLTWEDGDASERVIGIQLPRDEVADDGETFTVRLGEPVLGGAALGEIREATITIEAYDPRAQTIDFPPLRDVAGYAPISLVANASSGRLVEFTLVSGPASLSGATLTPGGPGLITVRAVQPGGADFDPAEPVERGFTVRRLATVTLGDLTQTYADAARPVSFSIDPAGAIAAVSYAGSPTAPRNAGSYPVSVTVVDSLVSGGASGTLTILKAPLSVAPKNQRRLVGVDNAPLSLVYNGLVGDDTDKDLDRIPVAKTTAKKTSKAGSYPITLSGGSDDNYAFELTSGSIEVVSFGGAYESLLVSESDGKLAGKVELTLSATGPGFTGIVNWAGEGASVSIKGSVLLDDAQPASLPPIAVGQSIAAAHGYFVKITRLSADDVQLNLLKGETLIAKGSGRRIHVPAAKSSVSWAGSRTAWVSDFVSIKGGDLRAVPAGAGHAVFTVPASGAFTLTANLPDGKIFKTPLRPDSDGAYRVFGRPYGTRANSYFVGEWDLKTLGARACVWRKAVAPSAVVDATFRPGFDLECVSQCAPWSAPKAATATSPGLAWADILGLDATTGIFRFEVDGVDFAGSADGLPDTLAITGAGKVTLSPATAANPRRFALGVIAKTGAFSGSFTLADGRKVSFGGALRPAPEAAGEALEIGRGFFVVPPAVKGSESIAGAISLIAPVAPAP